MAVWVPIIAALASIIPSVVQAVKGGKQQRMAEQLERDYPLPETQVAPSMNRLTNYAYGRMMSQDIPGGEIYRNEIKGATASGIRAASELGAGAEAYGALGQMVGREQNQFSELARLTAQQVMGYQGDYMTALGNRIPEENRVWEWNKARPYLQAANMASQLRGAGPLNTQAGLSNVFGSLAEYGSSLGRENEYRKQDNATLETVIKAILENFGSSGSKEGPTTTSGKQPGTVAETILM